MASKHAMIQVSGTTYRIRSERERHQVFRVSDDRRVGAFEHRPVLRVLDSDGPHDEVLEIARMALRAGRLPWSEATRPAARPRSTQPSRRTRASRSLTSLLVLLWPST